MGSDSLSFINYYTTLARRLNDTNQMYDALVKMIKQGKKLILSVSCLFLCCFLWLKTSTKYSAVKTTFYFDARDELLLHPSTILHQMKQHCTMVTCFDISKCKGEFKLYVYPHEKADVSPNYAIILKAALRSRYYTSDPKEACIFLPSLDPLDRDRLSSDYQKDLEKRLKDLPHWNKGQNHLIFNLYSGTYPEYKDSLDINIGKAILVKASVSSQTFRENFDISLPLFSKVYPLSAAGHLPSTENIFPWRRKYLVSFKGKRYLNGFGRETRNALYKLNNGKDILMLTTCKHGKKWRETQDERCSYDNEMYERFDYQEILQNSTFCFAPRGRRLGSFRFLESLSVGCIPVVLANDYQLPFNEVIDWKRALILADERQLYEVGLILRAISDEKITLLRQQNQFLWEAYFSSVEKIVSTVIEIMQQRVSRQYLNSYKIWNTFPGALVSLANYSENITYSPPLVGNQHYKTFTAVLVVKVEKLQKILTLARNLSKSDFIEKIVIIWTVSENLFHKSIWPAETVVVRVEKTDVQRLPWNAYVKTDAVFLLDNFASISPEEINLAFSIWKTFPNRITGIYAASHFWNEKSSRWSYTGKIGIHHNNGYSIISLSAAFYHRYYDHLYTKLFPSAFQNNITSYDDCLHIAMNFLVAHATRLPPIKVLKYDYQRTRQGTAPINYSVRNTCFQFVANYFGYIPLLYSNVAFVFR